MNNRKLQAFIEENIGKKYGDEYKYDMILLGTRYRGGIEGQPAHGIEVSVAIPQGYVFSMVVETDMVSTAVDFYVWLVYNFFPAMHKKWAEMREKE